jgi:hypothetical protein
VRCSSIGARCHQARELQVAAVMTDRDYWLSLAVYDQFRGVPVRKLISENHFDLKAMDSTEQALLIRLGSLFFQGRTWRKVAGHTTSQPEQRLSEGELSELRSFVSYRFAIGSAFLRMLDEDETLNPVTRDVTVERLEHMGLLQPDYKI